MRALVFMLAFALLSCESAGTLHAAGKKYDTGVARYDAAVKRGCDYLRNKALNTRKVGHEDERSLAAYALLKAGEDYEQEPIAGVIQSVLGKVRSGEYRPTTVYEHIYEAGVDAMLLADSDPDQFRPEIAAIGRYIKSVQRADGSWSHPMNAPGDVSMTQYGVLGMWAVHRAKADPDLSVLEKASRWYFSVFNNDGGFGYRPGTNEGPGKGKSTLNMSLAAMGSMAISRFVFFPDSLKDGREKRALKFGIAKGVKLKDESKGDQAPFKSTIGRGTYDNAVARSFGWVSANWTPFSRAEHKIYYYYAMERAFALANVKQVRGADWFTACGDVLLQDQQDDGSWKTHQGELVGTSFAVLFYMRSTGKILGIAYGGGILKAARGLPDDLTQAFNPDDEKSKEKVELDPLDELLAELEKADLSKIGEHADDIVQKIQLGDREELVGQLDRLKKLIDHPSADVRRTVIYAMGRSGDFSVVPDLLDNLEFNNVDVMREAHEALCYVSRKPNGFGIPRNPLEGFEGGSADQRGERIVNWRGMATRKWKTWWFKVRPYDLRDDFEEASIMRAEAAAGRK